MLMRWCAEPDPDGPLGPGNGVGLNQLLDAVLPEDPGMHSLRDGWGGDRHLSHLLWLQAPRFTLGQAWTFGHASGYRTSVRVGPSAVVCAVVHIRDANGAVMFQRGPDGPGQYAAGGQCPIRPGDPCSLCVPGATGPQDCGLVYLVMSDPDLRDRLRQIRTASV